MEKEPEICGIPVSAFSKPPSPDDLANIFAHWSDWEQVRFLGAVSWKMRQSFGEYRALRQLRMVGRMIGAPGNEAEETIFRTEARATIREIYESANIADPNLCSVCQKAVDEAHRDCPLREGARL
jgi:hypothetical protein